MITAASEQRIQTAFRLKSSVLSGAKRRATIMGMSLNAYVEKLLENDSMPELPKISRKELFMDMHDYSCTDNWKEPTVEELKADPRLAAILGYKYEDL